MQPCIRSLHPVLRRALLPLVVLCGFALSIGPHVARAADAAGTITGTVSNTATGNLLEGARVEVPQLGLSALTDHTGRYVLNGVPAGSHEVVASYTGLDPLRQQLTMATGQRAVQNFNLTSGVYQLQEM